MKSHLNLKLNGQTAELPPDFEMSFHDENPIFNGNELWSEPAALPVKGNRHILEGLDQPDYGRRATEFDKMKAEVEVEGLPMRHGWSRVQDNTLIDGSLDMNIDASAQSFDDLIGDLECRDVPLKDDIKIGEKIGNVHVDVEYLYQCSVTYNSDSKKGDQTKTYLGISEALASSDFEPQALGFSQPGVTSPWGQVNGITVGNRLKTYPEGHQVAVPRFDVNYINVSEPYGSTVNSPYTAKGGGTLGWPFCNARVAYTHYKKDDTTVPASTSDVVDLGTNNQIYESMNPYWVLDAQRPQSGICFYVLYFLDCLFAHLGVTFDNSELLKIEDLKHLAFFTTHCKFDSVYESGASFSGELDGITEIKDVIVPKGWMIFEHRQEWIEKYTEQEYNNQVFRDVNGWLDDRGCGGMLWVYKPTVKSVQDFAYDGPDGVHKEVVVGQNEVAAIEHDARIKKISYSAKVMSMYANSENFPDASVSDVISSLEASFGIRFDYDYERRHVKAYLLREMFRTSDAPVKLSGEVLSVIPMTDLTSGVRMKYSNEGTDKEQRQNVKKGIRDYDTDYDYIDYPEGRVVVDKTFSDIRGLANSNNMNVYVDLTTGNAYRYKVDKETLGKPVLFEVGQFKGVEIGDCSKENEDNVVEYASSFVPVPFNRVSAYQEQMMGSTKNEYTFDGGYKISKINSNIKPTYAAFIDEEMEHEFITQRIDNVLDNQFVDISCSEVLNLVESYDPSQTDDGNSPLQSYDWGLAIAMMRGGGTNMTVNHYDYNYDFFGNSKWKTTAGDYAMSTDSMTPDGEDYDYNGDYDGDGGGERLSLKIRAYKSFRYKIVGGKTLISTNPSEWADDPTWLLPCAADEVSGTEITRRIKTRGLADTMMAEMIHFLLNKKKLQITMRMPAAQLADLPNHWNHRVQIGDMIGFINDAKWSAHVTEGISNVVIEFFYI